MAPILDNVRREGLQSILNNLRKKEDIEYNSLIISIDFGTTYSGYYLIRRNAMDQSLILNQDRIRFYIGAG